MTAQSLQNSLLGKIAAYTEILAKDPRSTIFVSLGEAYRKMGMLDDARQVIEKGVESHPDFGPAHIVLGRILCQQGEYQSSEAAFQRALKHDPESLAALVGYARLNILLGVESKAREVLLTARELSPADPIINKLLLSLPETVHEEVVDPVSPMPVEDETVVAPKLAVASFSEEKTTVGAVAKEAPPLVSATLAELYLKQGLSEQALEAYRQLSARDPDNLQFRRKIRDLEGGLPDESESPAVVAPEDIKPVIDSEETTGGEDVSFETDAVPEEALEEPVDTDYEESIADEPKVVSSNERVVATLNRWLASIQKRRKDV